MTTLMSDEWAQEIFQLLRSWPDDAERADPRKIENYWTYFERKRDAFNGTFALGIRGIPGTADTSYLTITYGPDGTVTEVAVRSAEEAKAQAKLAMECDFQTWRDMAGGYDISKAMTYHQLPLTVGSSDDLLRCVYFLHELIVAALRPATDLPTPVSA